MSAPPIQHFQIGLMQDNFLLRIDCGGASICRPDEFHLERVAWRKLDR